jgi:AmiR/NasT family two-component response regulator
MQSFATRTVFTSCSHEAHLAAVAGKVAELEAALATARGIGIAVGIVMSMYKISDDEAVDLLARACRNTGREMSDVAADVAADGTLNWGAKAFS